MTEPTFTRDPKFGYHPWIGPGKPLTLEEHDQHVAAGKLYSGADTLSGDIQYLPSGLNAYMSYVDNYGGWGELVNRFGKTGATLISITIFGNPARCADVEPGAMHPTSVPSWLDYRALRDGGQIPWVYTSAGNWGAVNPQIGSRKVIRWSAHYGYGPHVCGPHTCGYPQADWTQWTDHGANGENLDRSVGLYLPTPPPSDPHGYHRFYDKVFDIDKKKINERDTVVEYDNRRQHPLLNVIRLRILRWHAGLLAGRIATVAKEQKDWKRFDRQWRYSQLTARSQGKKVV